MPRSLFAFLLCTACSTIGGPGTGPIQPRAWAKGERIAVEVGLAPDSQRFAGNAQGDGALQSFARDLRADLGRAGFTAVDGPADLTVTAALSFTGGASSAGVARNGVDIDHVQAKATDLDCYSIWKTSPEGFEENLACLSRALVGNLLASDRFARSRAVAAAAAPSRQAAPPGELRLSGKLAVLELRNYTKDLTRENTQYFTDVVRQKALRMQPQLDVMTRENLVVLLQASGRKLEDCEGECEVETGRRIGADEIISGEIQKLGSSYKLTLRLHDTREGKLLTSAIASGKSIDELDVAASKAAEELFTGQSR